MLKEFVLLAIFNYALSTPIVIKSGLSSSSSADHGQRKNSDVYDTYGNKAEKNFVNQEGYDAGSEKKLASALDQGSYGHENQDKKLSHEQGSFADKKYHDNHGGSESNFGKKLGHKKGHHKSGFHNTYHKDESGSNSSYWDDSNDEAEAYENDNRRGAYGDVSSRQNQGGFQDGSSYLNHNGRQGNFKKAGQYEKDVGNRKNYNQGQYYDNNQRFGKSNAANAYGEHGRREQEKIYTKPYYNVGGYYPEDRYYQKPYYEKAHYASPQKRVITVYEDPRYYEKGYEFESYNPGYNSDSVRLDMRPPLELSRFESVPYYDDYYW